MKIPLTAEILAETGDGKTHFAMTMFPDPCLIDSTDTVEAPLVLKKLFSDWERRYFRVESWSQFEEAVKVKAAGFKTVVFDMSKHLQSMAVPQWVKDNPGRKRPLPTDYDDVRAYGRDLLRLCANRGQNIVACTQMKDEYGKPDEKGIAHPTGERLPDSFKPMPVASRLIVFIRRGGELAGGVRPRNYKVIKNTSRDSADPNDWIGFIDSMDGGLKSGKTDEERDWNWIQMKKLMKMTEEEACQ